MTEIKEKIEPRIEDSWKSLLFDEFNRDRFTRLKEFLRIEKSKYRIFPPGKRIFSAFDLCPVGRVKAVILGQDPYHGYGQAHGLCFSVPDGVPQPPSLVNILKELKDDVNVKVSRNGNLEKWAGNGVLLLNATLTVRAGQAGSHQGKGWEEFTDGVIEKISQNRDHVAFLLWGKYAQAKEGLIDKSKHLVLKAAHPSPFSARNGFFGCRHFSKTNSFLAGHNIDPINWELDE